MPRTKKVTRRPSYRAAVDWVAHNDCSADGDSQEWIAAYVTTGFVADMFGVAQDVVAQDIAQARRKAGITVGEDN